MGGGEKKKANAMIDQQVATQNAQSAHAQSQYQPELDKSKSNASNMYDVMYGGYKNLAESGNPSALFGSGGGGGGGGYSVAARDPKFAETEAKYREGMNTGLIDQSKMREGYGTFRGMMENGGWDPSRVASMDSNIAGMKEMGRTGGLDDAAQARMRGGGVFDEFSNTGGLSTQDRGNLRARGNAVIPSFYGQARAEAARQGAVQGGYGPGQSALFGRLSRQQAAGAQDAALNTELGITDRVNSGRQWGAEGMAQSENALQGMRTGNMMAGLKGASAVEQTMQDSINQGKMFGSSQITDAEKNIQELAQRGAMWGTEGLGNLAAQDENRINAGNAASAANSASSAANDKWNAEFGLRTKLAGLEGMGALYGSSPAETARYEQQQLQDRALTYGSNAPLISDKLHNNASAMDNFGNILGNVSSIAGSVSGGISGFGGNTGVAKRRQPVSV